MKSRTILLIDSDQSTRRQRVVMLLTHGYLVRAEESIEKLKLPFAGSPPDLVLLRADEPQDRPESAYAAIRNAVPNQRIGFLLEEGHKLCELFLDGILARPREQVGGDLIHAVKAMFETRSFARHAMCGS
jgi:hypothetical protein